MEIEAKFGVPDEATWLKLQTMDQIAGYALSPGKTKHVHDTFMDTPDRSILASGHVCRKREVDGQILMTLKSGQTVQGAVHRREELEVTLEREQPIGQWPPSEIRDRLLGIIGDVVLVPLFDQRQTRIIRWATKADRVVAEMSVDKVELSLKGRAQSYFEVEFELKEVGTEDDLAVIAACLQNEWDLKPEQRSKFARALALASD
ncbi:MAG TPA: CYTH domain-containing protein [Anaerolineae bacterium]|nr:CYTH domain-containing protein [Anaerolineae bacterium]